MFQIIYIKVSTVSLFWDNRNSFFNSPSADLEVRNNEILSDSLLTCFECLMRRFKCLFNYDNDQPGQEFSMICNVSLPVTLLSFFLSFLSPSAGLRQFNLRPSEVVQKRFFPSLSKIRLNFVFGSAQCLNHRLNVSKNVSIVSPFWPSSHHFTLESVASWSQSP